MSKAGAVTGPASGQKDKGAYIMLKKIIISTAAAATALTALPAAAEAQSRYGYSRSYDNGHYSQSYNRVYANRNYARGYYSQGRYAQPYYGGYYSHYGRRCSGTTGTIIGAIAGGLLGSSIASRHDGALGAILGAGAGALAGNAIDRSDCR